MRSNMPISYWLDDDSNVAIGHLENIHATYNLWQNSPIKLAWVRNFIAYHSAMVNQNSWDSSFIWGGEQGELLKFFSPKARTLMRQLIGLVCKQKLSFEAMAQSGGQDIITDVKIANALLSQIVTEQRLNNKAEDLVENALVMGAGFLKTTWRTDSGDPIGYKGKLIYKGSVDISVQNVFDTYYDVNLDSWDDLTWAECRTSKNRWDLIAQHPKLKNEIMSLPSLVKARGPNYWFTQSQEDDDDLVSIYECYAKPSPALPKGRMLIYGSSDCVIYDDDNPYGFIPIEPMIPEKIQGSLLGYPKLSDILASNEMLDTGMSSIATNLSQFAVQSVTIPRGSNVNVQDLNGMRYISYTPQQAPGGGKPEALQLTNSPPEVFKFIDMLDKNMGEMSSVHEVLRGQTEGATSGAMVATLTANAIENIDSFTKSYHLCMERTMKNAIDCYKRFAKLEQNLTITGKNNQVYGTEFTGAALENIHGVQINVSNPLMQTIAGRMEIATQLQQMPEEMRYDYVNIIEGKPLSSITNKYLSESDLTWSENEALKDGKEVPALATDDHPYHIKEHSKLLNDPEIRKNSDKIGIILAHIEEHKMLEETTDPALLAMVRGQTPQPMQQGIPGPQGQPKMPAMGEEELMRDQDLFAPPEAEEGIEMENKVAQPAADMLGRTI